VDGELGRELSPAQARQHHVDNEQVDRARMAVRERHGGLPVGSDDNGVAGSLEDPLGQAPDLLLILHQEDRFARVRRTRRGTWAGFVVFHCREQDGERGSLSRLAGGRHVAAALAHYAMNRREAEPGFAPAGSERLEDPIECAPSQRRSGVTDLERRITARSKPGAGVRLGFLDLHRCRRQP
jgi:hypothetical protein